MRAVVGRVQRETLPEMLRTDVPVRLLIDTIYEYPQIVSMYAKHMCLQPPERVLLERLHPKLNQMDVLDIGVGAGRTAHHLAPAARSYLGVDYSQAMIDRCKADFPGYRFMVGDARCLNFAKDAAFDLVLFSFNGIDHAGKSERATILREMIRVLRPGGLMVFSSHNTNYLSEIAARFKFRVSDTLGVTLRSLKWSILFKLKNLRTGLRAPFIEGLVHDGSHSFRSRLYYIRPDAAIEELRALQMEDISCAGYDGEEFLLASDPRIPTLKSPWIYYVCRKPSD